MNERVIWEGDENLLTEERLEGVGDIWFRGGDYTAVPKDGKCYIHWGQKPVLVIADEEKDGTHKLIMRQNPNMGEFPDKVMDRYAVMMRQLTEHLTRNLEKTDDMSP